MVDKSAKIQILEEVIKQDHRNIQTHTEEFEEPVSELHYDIGKEQPNIFKQPKIIYSVTLQELPSDKYPPKLCKSLTDSCGTLDFKRFKEVIVLYGRHPLFVKQMLNTWPTCNRIIPQDCEDFGIAISELVTLLHWRIQKKDEAKTIEQGFETSQDQPTFWRS